MGMFDEITVEYPLPDLPSDGEWDWQTKSLDNFMEQYRIDVDGVLWREHYDTEDKSDPTATGIARIVGMLTRVNRTWERENYTGEIRFYDKYDQTATWYEYVATFSNGQLMEVHRFDLEPK